LHPYRLLLMLLLLMMMSLGRVLRRLQTFST